MKIGILTYHRAHNYGALLQAVALRYYLQEQGHEVYYIDYWPDYHRDAYKVFNGYRFRHGSLRKKISVLCDTVINYWGKKKRIASFSSFIKKYIDPFSCPYESQIQYDIVIYGSDQIWRKQNNMEGFSFNPVYFGRNSIDANKHIAYAASMGNICLEQTDKEFLIKELSSLSKISVREQDLYDVLCSLGLKSDLVLDPTFLLDSSKWDEIIHPQRLIEDPYVLLYQLQNSIERVHAKKFADERGLKLVVLASKYDYKHSDDISNASPEDFISLIKYAEVVLTSSYHGLVFSINYNKQVYCAFKTNSNRASTILKSLGISDRMLKPNLPLPNRDELIDWKNSNFLLAKQRSESQDYLNFDK